MNYEPTVIICLSQNENKFVSKKKKKNENKFKKRTHQLVIRASLPGIRIGLS